MANIFDDEYYILWRLINQTRNAMLKSRQKELAKYGLSHRESGILLLAEATDGKMTPYQMAKCFVIEPHSISKLVRKMEQEGLISIVTNINRKKATNIQLTEKGLEVCQKIKKINSIRNILSVISKGDCERLVVLLKTLRNKALEEIGVKPVFNLPPY